MLKKYNELKYNYRELRLLMKTSKNVISELCRAGHGRKLTDDELNILKKKLLDCYLDVSQVCDKYKLRIMLGGGSCLGAIRHHGFIPWDDDFDVNMPREDFEKFKEIFEEELGNKYILNAPNYSQTSSNRFPKILIKDTRFIELGMRNDDEAGMIKIDIFTAENVPDNPLAREIKGIYCNFLMGIAGGVQYIEWYRKNKNDPIFKTNAMRNYAKKKRLLGGIFSFKSSQYWFNMVDKVCQYHGKSSLIGFPTGRRHYFGEIHRKEDILPLANAIFEGHIVHVAKNVDKYLTKLYGSNYMEMPSPEKREGHMIMDIQFNS